MGARNALAKTKGLLFELTSQILDQKTDGSGVVSGEIVKEFLRKHKIPEEEIQEIIRLGLMVLAGKVTTMNRAGVAQLDIYEREKLPIFVDLRIEGVDGKYRTQRYDVKKLKPSVIIKHSAPQIKNKSVSKRDALIAWAHKQVASGHGEVAVEDSR